MTNWKFIFRNLKNNMQSHVLLSVGLILNLAFVYCFLFLGLAADSYAPFRIAFHYGSMSGTAGTCAKISMISGLFLMISIAFPYIKGRIREYSLLMILGIQKKRMSVLLGAEYAIIWGITLFAGLLLGTALSVPAYAVLKASGYPVGTVNWLAIGCSVWSKVLLLSVGYLACTLAYLAVRTDSRNLSELAAESVKPEKMKKLHQGIKFGIIGIFLVVFSMLLKFQSRFLSAIVIFKDEEIRNAAAFVFLIVGMYLLVASGMSVVLACMKRSKRGYFKNALSIRSVMFRVSTYKNTIFAVLLISFAVLFSLGDSIVIFSDEERDYSWRYPHDFVGSMTEEEAGKWEKICRENGDEKGLISVPYVDLESMQGGRFLGISESSYEKLTSKNVQLKKGQMLMCIQWAKSDADKILTGYADWKDVPLEFGKEVKDYAIQKKEVDVLTVGGIYVNVAVFENGDYQEIVGKLNPSELLVVQDFEKGRQSSMNQKAQDFKRNNPEIPCITRSEALHIEELVDSIVNAINIFCMFCITIAGLLLLGIKLFSEIPVLGGKYRFLSDVGMERTQIKKEVGKEIWPMIFIPVFFGIFMAAIYKANILAIYIRANSEYHFYSEGGLTAFVWGMSKDWLFVLAVFCLIQLLYGKYMIMFIKRRVIREAFGLV